MPTAEATDACTIIKAEGLHKAYGDTVAVRDLSFSVEAEQVLGLLGPTEPVRRRPSTCARR